LPKTIEEATRDEALRAKWKDDPLNRLKLSPKELIHFQRFMNDNHDTAKRITKTPVLFVVGMSDKLVKPEGSIELYKEVASSDKKMMTIKSAEHLIFEQGRMTPAVFTYVVSWLNSHAAIRQTTANDQRRHMLMRGTKNHSLRRS